MSSRKLDFRLRFLEFTEVKIPSKCPLVNSTVPWKSLNQKSPRLLFIFQDKPVILYLFYMTFPLRLICIFVILSFLNSQIIKHSENLRVNKLFIQAVPHMLIYLLPSIIQSYEFIFTYFWQEIQATNIEFALAPQIRTAKIWLSLS